MGKLNGSMASKKHLEKNGLKSEPISDEMQKEIKEAGEAANEKIKLNNSVYNQSNSHSHETKVQTKAPNQISKAESVMNDFMEKLDNGNLICEKESPLEEEAVLDKEFIDEKLESYGKTLKFYSGMMQDKK